MDEQPFKGIDVVEIARATGLALHGNQVLRRRDRDRDGSDAYGDGSGHELLEVQRVGDKHVYLARRMVRVVEGEDLHVLEPALPSVGISEATPGDRYAGETSAGLLLVL